MNNQIFFNTVKLHFNKITKVPLVPPSLHINFSVLAYFLYLNHLYGCCFNPRVLVVMSNEQNVHVEHLHCIEVIATTMEIQIE